MYHYLLNEIPSIFPNITTLVLNNSIFTMDTLQSLFDNFNSLENLDLTENIICHYAKVSLDYIIKYPISLRSLKLRGTSVMMVLDNNNSIGISNYRYNNRLYTFDMTYQHLPNLVTFDHETQHYYPDENSDLFGFIKLNPQLKSIKVSGICFNFGLFDIIKNYDNLTHFKFDCNYRWEDLLDYEMPVLRNIKHLHLKRWHLNVTNIFTGNLPNVNELVIELDWSISNSENNLIQIIPNLRSLKFISNKKSKFIKNLTLPKLNSLEKLEFNLNYDGGRFEHVKWDVSACDKLKLVTYTKNEIFTPFEKPEITEEIAKQWDFYYFSHKLTFIKSS